MTWLKWIFTYLIYFACVFNFIWNKPIHSFKILIFPFLYCPRTILCKVFPLKHHLQHHREYGLHQQKQISRTHCISLFKDSETAFQNSLMDVDMPPFHKEGNSLLQGGMASPRRSSHTMHLLPVLVPVAPQPYSQPPRLCCLPSSSSFCPNTLRLCLLDEETLP